MRIIDADFACKGCIRYGTSLPCEECVVKDAPTVDAVSVVRCEYCNKGHPELGMNSCVWCVRYSRDMNTDDFCSYGERKEDS